MKLIDLKPRRVILNITPLVDVLFILIIFFTVSSTFLEQPGIKLELPKAASAKPERVEKAVLSISSDEKIFFRGEEITLEDLPNVLQTTMKNSQDKSLIISADKETHHGLVVAIMDVARQNGVKKLVISTKPE
ncbi:MAG: biopolymer transporter ExbD [Calditrichaeota bacterium]|nr:MAG: biopolymer transporter ExbD [Calditrichota bacterium]